MFASGAYIMKSSKYSLLAIAAVVAISSSSYATIIPNGGAVVAVPVAPLSGGAALVSTSTQPFAGLDFSSNVVFTGVETSSDFSGDTNNSLGGLTFIYNITNDEGSPDTIDRVTLSGFAGFAADVGFIDPGGTFTPVVITRSSDGNIIGFDYSAFSFPNNEISPGGASAYMFIRTNAPFDTTNTMTITDGGSGTALSFGPSSSNGGTRTPEPASLGIIGLGGLAVLRRRRSK